MRLCFQSLLISCSVTTAFGTLSCINNVVFSQRLPQPLPSPPKISSNRSPYCPRIGDALSGCHREAARFYLFGTTVKCCTVPDALTEPIRNHRKEDPGTVS